MRTIQYICKGFLKNFNFCLSFSCKWKIIQSKFGFSVRGEQKLCYFLESIKKTYFEAILESLWRNDDTDKCKALHVYTGTKFNFFVKWIF